MINFKAHLWPQQNENALDALNWPTSRKHSDCTMKAPEPLCKQLVTKSHGKSRPVSSAGQSVVLITPRSRVRSPYGPHTTEKNASAGKTAFCQAKIFFMLLLYVHHIIQHDYAIKHTTI